LYYITYIPMNANTWYLKNTQYKGNKFFKKKLVNYYHFTQHAVSLPCSHKPLTYLPSLARSIQSTPFNPTSLKFILIISYYLRLGLPNALFHSGFTTKALNVFFLFSPPVLTNRYQTPINKILGRTVAVILSIYSVINFFMQ
jgi:hypothetical protein